ncbi:MAG: 3-deoxy-7-phosphoheptulonate synthase [Chloroflexi bacterium]|nr:3-deoxy-7-phosphoheptulonate synthase [Chloroflexota bacterium]MCI0814344.1 3-deoxy-7-phosphoheptulonate synthase [Chloroflexota bacterium]MCI0817232.1 3-deoxy-7-phosphoheptulonate synthase [Chloroflexota bacterium]MCI0819439.1 3-deoxy-7-phosphoheptulonate synthase [Chloroflexota bacterium]MCI0832835.1 3-deoxy-7-phosphoheptulonate synthase [Chloroflexota bacterium]
MIVVMKTGATDEQVAGVRKAIKALGFKAHPILGEERSVVAVLGHVYPELVDELGVLDGVDSVVRISKPFKLASREVNPFNTVVRVGNVSIGDGNVVVMGGPCSVDTEENVIITARAVRDAGGHILRGGAFKPRSSPYAFRGHGEKGLKMLAAARDETGLPIITEVMDPRDVELVAKYADILQIGARNMQNFTLLDEVGKAAKPVMLKRGLSGTIEEWLLAAEYILSHGNRDVILCERGIRTYETATRNTFDINAIPLVKRLSHLPIIGDPSHATGAWYLVEPVGLAAIAAGADGLIVEVHPEPDHALSDGAQSLTPKNFAKLIERTRTLAQALGRDLAPSGATEEKARQAS